MANGNTFRDQDFEIVDRPTRDVSGFKTGGEPVGAPRTEPTTQTNIGGLRDDDFEIVDLPAPAHQTPTREPDGIGGKVSGFLRGVDQTRQGLKQAGRPKPQFKDSDFEIVEPEDPGFGEVLAEGAKDTMQHLKGTAVLAGVGDKQDYLKSYLERENERLPTGKGQQKLVGMLADEWKDVGQEETFWGQAYEVGDMIAKGVAGAVTDPKATADIVVRNLPNMAPTMAGMGAGAAAGSLVGPVGAVVGGLIGMTAGTTAIESGAKLFEKLQERSPNLDEKELRAALNDEEFIAETQREGLTKGAIISGIDAVSMGILGKMMTGPGRALQKGVQDSLRKQGVDVADPAQVSKALMDPEIAASLKPHVADYKSATSLPKKAGRGAGAIGIETVGEGVGELFGERAASGEWQGDEAFIEAIAGFGTSLGQAGAVAGTVGRRKKTQADKQADAIEALPTEPDESVTLDETNLPAEPQAETPPEEVKMEGGAAQDFSSVPVDEEVELYGYQDLPETPDARPSTAGIEVEDITDGPSGGGTTVSEITPEEITVEGHAQPDLSDFLERGGIARNDGTPFPTKKAAELKAKSRKLESYEPVKVGSGWGLRPPETTPQAPDTPTQPASAQDLDQAAQQAATSPQNKTPEPTEGQREAGNYKKGKVRLNGMEISVENPKGSTRSGTNRRGENWSVTMKDHYGYLRKTEGSDGEQIDVFMTDQAHRQRPVFVVDQVDPETGRFDEHKVIMGTRNEDQARRVYQRNYEKGWQGLGAITQMSQDEFKAWTQGDTTKPVGLQTRKAEKPAPQEPGLVGKYVRSGSTVGRVTEVSEDGKKATLESGSTVPVGRAPNWTVQDEPFPDAEPAAQTEPTTETTAEPAKPKKAKKAEPEQKIEDFGEVLHGARKHYAQKLKDAESVDIAAEPLSKSWPEPNYQQLLDEGIDPWTVAFIHAARDEVPRKPAKSWKLKQWVKQVEALRGTAENMLSSPETARQAQKGLREHPVLEPVERRTELYQAVGHEHSLKGVKFGVSRYSMLNGEKFDPPKEVWEVTKSAKATAFSNMPRVLAKGNTKEEAVEAFKKVVDSGVLDQSRKKNIRFDIYSKRGEKGVFTTYIGKKIGRDYIDLETFDSAKEAREYLKNNQDALEKKLAKFKDIPDHRKASNSPRVGVDHRNDADVAPEQFTETFGFRGVQFGNYVEGPRRQQDLNEAYDALLDLAGILNLPARALSLNGELGLAFGARGKGGKGAGAAHFEPDSIVINLTKRAGAGSLAHEWWHSLDNYFARQRDQGGGFLTETTEVKREGVRPEMVQAFREVVQAINRTRLRERSRQLDKTRTEPYWQTGREMSARSFESYVIERLRDQEGSNDYLANIVSEEYWEAAAALGLEKGGTYPYPEAAEIPVIRAGFDNFFQTVETRETDQGTAMFSVEGQPSFANEALSMMVQNQDVFQYPISKAKSMPAIARKMGFPITVESRQDSDVDGIDYTWSVTMPEGRQAMVVEADGEVWIDASELRMGENRGSLLYHVVANYAYNNGKVFRGDPAGLSYSALLRRTENMLSSALKFGTTRHLKPHDRQIDDLGIEWTTDDNHNLDELLRASVVNTLMEYPVLAEIRYNFDTDQFENTVNGEPVTEATFREIADSGSRTGKAQAGSRTLKRAALIQSLVSEAGGEVRQRRRILDEFARLVRTGELPQVLRQIFYSQQPRPRAGLFRGISVQDATNSLRQILGKKAFDRLVASGRFEIVQGQTEIPEVARRSESGDPVTGVVKGMYSPTEGKTYIVADNIRPEQLEGVFLHEVGAHYGLPRMIGRTEYEKVKRQLQNLHRIGNKRIVEARNRVPKSTPEQYVWDETLAYLAEKNHDMPLVQRIIAKVRAFLKELGILRVSRLTDSDIIELVRGAAVHAAKTAPKRPVRTRPGVYDKVAKGLTPKGTSQSYARQVRQMVRDGQITQAQADRIIPWLNQHKRTPSPSERLDETVLDIPAKRSRVIRRDDVLAFLSSQGLMSQESRRKQRLRDMGMDFENLPGDLEGSQTRPTAPVDQEPEAVDSETARENLRKRGLNGPDAPEGMFSIEREYTEEQKRAIEKGRFGERGAQPTARERINASKYLIGTKFRQKVIDQFASLNKVLGDPRAWMMAQMSKGSTGALEAVIEFGRPFLKDNAIGVDIEQNGLKDVLAPLGEEMDDWMKWMAGNRAANLKAQDRERLFDDGEIEALQSLNQGTMADGRNRAEVYEQARQQYEALNQAVNQIAVDTGLISDEEAQEWADQGFYIPFYRMMEDEGRGPGVFRNSLVKQNAYKKLKGAAIPLDDLLGNIIQNWHHLLSASMRNQAAVKALDSAQKMGIAQQVSEAEASKDAIWVREDGEQAWYEFDDSQESKLVLESLLSLNYEGMQQFSMKVMRKFKRGLTIGVTVNPEFRIANLIRDTLHSAAVVPVSPNIVKNVIQGIRLTKRGTQFHASMIAGAGAFGDSGYIHGTDPELLRRTMTKGVGRDTILDTRGRIRKMWDRYQDWGARMENVNRAAAINQALMEGKDLLEANFEGRDLLDFQRSGSAAFVRVLTQTVPFLNARLQGLDKMYRAVQTPGQRRQFATVAGVYALAAVGLYLMMRDDDDYKEAEEWEKDAYHLFKIPGSDVMYRIPKPFEVGVIGTLAERLTEQVVDDNAHGALFSERLAHALGETLSFNPIPQAALPMFELVANKNFFTGRNIENLSMSRLSPEERKRAWTSQTAIGASQAMSKILWDDVTLSPVQVEHLVNGYLGWMGGSILGATDMLVSRPLAQSPDQPERRVEDYPVVGRFIREADSRNSKFVTRFYENLNDVTYAWGDIRQARELGNREKAKAKIEENRDVLKYREAYNRVQRDFGKINSRITQIHMDENLTPKQKRNKIDLLNKRKKQIARRIVEASSDAFH